MMADWHEINALFHVVEKAQGHPNLYALRDAAVVKLREEADVILRAAGTLKTAPSEKSEPAPAPAPARPEPFARPVRSDL